MDFAGDHVLVAYFMKPVAGYGFLAAAALRGGVLHWHQRVRAATPPPCAPRSRAPSAPAASTQQRRQASPFAMHGVGARVLISKRGPICVLQAGSAGS